MGRFPRCAAMDGDGVLLHCSLSLPGAGPSLRLPCLPPAPRPLPAPPHPSRAIELRSLLAPRAAGNPSPARAPGASHAHCTHGPRGRVWGGFPAVQQCRWRGPAVRPEHSRAHTNEAFPPGRDGSGKARILCGAQGARLVPSHQTGKAQRRLGFFAVRKVRGWCLPTRQGRLSEGSDPQGRLSEGSGKA